MKNEIIPLNPGDELYIPAGVVHGGECIAGTNNTFFWRKESRKGKQLKR